MSAASLGAEKYVSFTTFRKNGERKSLPVWIVELGDGTLAFTTGADSWKVKRLANDPRVELQPCDQRGGVRSGTSVTPGTAKAVSGAAFEEVRALVHTKYRLMSKAIDLAGKLRTKLGRGESASCAVVITLD